MASGTGKCRCCEEIISRNLSWCKNEECQAHRRAFKQAYQQQYRVEHLEKIRETYKKYCKKKTLPGYQPSSRLDNDSEHYNWCYHHHGNCEVCGQKMSLNRFNFCLDCYREAAIRVSGNMGSIYTFDMDLAF
ncbi:MAG: hypothetical protein DRH26_11650 [Deltaproteobacteria bacterium]|nr:MAG: hypothetical protein DRH26_11650 [Deltaproteobacteria bacterium]